MLSGPDYWNVPRITEIGQQWDIKEGCLDSVDAATLQQFNIAKLCKGNVYKLDGVAPLIEGPSRCNSTTRSDKVPDLECSKPVQHILFHD